MASLFVTGNVSRRLKSVLNKIWLHVHCIFTGTQTTFADEESTMNSSYITSINQYDVLFYNITVIDKIKCFTFLHLLLSTWNECIITCTLK